MCSEGQPLGATTAGWGTTARDMLFGITFTLVSYTTCADASVQMDIMRRWWVRNAHAPPRRAGGHTVVDTLRQGTVLPLQGSARGFRRRWSGVQASLVGPKHLIAAMASGGGNAVTDTLFGTRTYTEGARYQVPR